MILYLTGSTNDVIEPRLLEHRIGLMNNPLSAYAPERVARFAFTGLDNACFRNNWIEKDWENWLVRQPSHNALFATLPDVYCDSRLSLERGMEYLPLVAELGLPAAVVAQGTHPGLAYPWSDFQCLFLGGEQLADPRAEWKESYECAELVREARNNGLWVHMGRVNDQYRYAHAERIGCHSVDGNMLGFGPLANIGRLSRMVRRRNNAPPLPFERFETPSHPLHRRVVL